MENFTVIDLFAGAGGFSLAAASAGAEVRLSVEVDPVACATLVANRKWHRGEILQADVATLRGAGLRKRLGLSTGDPLVIVGGAPCQPFSKAAYWTDPGEDARYRRARAEGRKAIRPGTPPLRADERRSLVGEFWRIVKETKAWGFVFENVPSILHPRHRQELENLRRQAAGAGFHTELIVANAVDFGVPQKRTRVFLLGASSSPHPAMPTHSTEERRPRGLKRTPSAGAAIARYRDPTFAEAEEVVRGRWAEHLRDVPAGWNYKAHTAWAGHPRPTFVTETRFWNFLLKLHPEQPSWTIAANPGPWTGPFHWDSRRLRVPELAALQGFPHGYGFEGTRRERVRQIGNAVPPPMATAMIESVLRAATKPIGRRNSTTTA